MIHRSPPPPPHPGVASPLSSLRKFPLLRELATLGWGGGLRWIMQSKTYAGFVHTGPTNTGFNLPLRFTLGFYSRLAVGWGIYYYENGGCFKLNCGKDDRKRMNSSILEAFILLLLLMQLLILLLVLLLLLLLLLLDYYYHYYYYSYYSHYSYYYSCYSSYSYYSCC